jgi:hypothetical protein
MLNCKIHKGFLKFYKIIPYQKKKKRKQTLNYLINNFKFMAFDELLVKNYIEKEEPQPQVVLAFGL